MKFLFLAGYLSITSICFTQNNWVRQITPISSTLNSLTFTDSLNGWAAGDDGVIIHTSDGGTNWLVQSSTIDFQISRITFITNQKGWAVANDYGTSSAILFTTNGGINWSSYRYPDSSKLFFDIYFINESTGYLCGYNGSFARTTNSGINWIPCNNDSGPYSSFPVNRIKMFNPLYGFACGGAYDVAGVIWKTVDGGLNWSSTGVSGEPLRDLHFFDSLNIIAVGGDFDFGANLMKTINGGNSWEYQSLYVLGFATSVSFRTPSEGWASLSYSRNFMKTTNTGVNWTTVSSPDTTAFIDVKFIGQAHGWSCGTNGAVFKYQEIIGINNEIKVIPSTFVLKQNYPNPFNPATNIAFSVPEPADVKLIVYDNLGREVSVLVNEHLNRGNYYFQFSGEKLASGIYFYRLVANGKNSQIDETKKLSLIK